MNSILKCYLVKIWLFSMSPANDAIPSVCYVYFCLKGEIFVLLYFVLLYESDFEMLFSKNLTIFNEFWRFKGGETPVFRSVL